MNRVNGMDRLHPVWPIYGLARAADGVVFVPGRLVRLERSEYDRVCTQLHAALEPSAAHSIGTTATEWLVAGSHAVRAWHDQSSRLFQPECVTVYLNNRCNSRCVYCYAADSRTASRDASSSRPCVSIGAIRAAARTVIANCQAKMQPFTFVIHGGGEPTLDFRRMQKAVQETREMAREAECEWRGHLATNGIMSGARADWIAENFTTIGLSHDGPPDLHDKQRPLRNGHPSLPIVERTLQRLLAGPARVYVRSTVMPEAVDRQVEMVDYLVGQLGVQEVRVEPAYRLKGPQSSRFDHARAKRFALAFLEARSRARALGARLEFSGARPGEVHGPYCEVLRNTLHLVPGNIASACFFCTGSMDNPFQQKIIGSWMAPNKEFTFDQARIADHCRRASRVSDTCQDCMARFHCTHGCPDICVAEDHAAPDPPSFRCTIIQEIVLQTVLETADRTPMGQWAAIQ